MLKDITIGQFFPGNSLIHKLDPRTKIMLITAFVITLFMLEGIFSYIIATTFIASIILISKISFKVIIKAIKPLVFIIIFTSVLNIFYATGEVLFKIWILEVTKEGLILAGFMVWRIILLVVSTSMLTYTTSPIVLTNGIENLLKPLKKINFPAHEFAMMMTIALRFIPTLIEETEKIINAQKARGADFESGNFITRAKALVPVLIPLFVSSFRRADELAVAMDCRLYRGDIGRTRLTNLKYKKEDFLVTIMSIILFVALILMSSGVI